MIFLKIMSVVVLCTRSYLVVYTITFLHEVYRRYNTCHLEPLIVLSTLKALIDTELKEIDSVVFMKNKKCFRIKR